ncbi:MAG: HRDC domain-containing protein [Actinomycetota bacterium]|nr:HRDC domain-containing protein [Actinomycetota bacterium]
MQPSDLAAAARAAGRLGVDTEFMGEGRYQALLCLVQVAVEHDGTLEVALLDPLDDALDPAPLAAVLADPEIEVVLHAARQDVALLRRVWRTEVRGVFDTQVAAGFAGLRAQMGYDALLAELLGLRLGKSASLTRWDQRPLSPEQITYAREDVLHLLEASDALQGRLAELGRLGWAREECRALERVSDERDPDALFARLPRINGLDPRARAVARELVEWRERTAREGDRPAASVLQDAALVELAKRRPRSPRELEALRGVGEATVRRRGKALLAAIEAGLERPPIPPEPGGAPPPDADDAPLVALAEAFVRARTLEAGLAYELVAARADLQRVVTAAQRGGEEPDVRVLRGWRRELVGDELLGVLAGERALRVLDGRVRVSEGT